MAWRVSEMFLKLIYSFHQALREGVSSDLYAAHPHLSIELSHLFATLRILSYVTVKALPE